MDGVHLNHYHRIIGGVELQEYLKKFNSDTVFNEGDVVLVEEFYTGSVFCTGVGEKSSHSILIPDRFLSQKGPAK